MLHPTTNKRRVAINLNGIWDFAVVADDHDAKAPLPFPTPIGVPSSYGEVFPDAMVRDHVGKVCYERRISVPAIPDVEWRLWFGAAAHRAEVYAEGILLGRHDGGFLPFEVRLPEDLALTGSFRLSVVLDNRLDFSTLPIGEIEERDGRRYQRINHDFANLTGIHRDVFLCAFPKVAIDDVVVATKGHGPTARVTYASDAEGKTRATILDPEGLVVARCDGSTGDVVLSDPILWDLGRGNLYTLRLETATDEVEVRFGIRDVEVKDGRFLLNGKPVFFRGFGMHEDHPLVGKASIPALNAKDFALLQWTNANSFRTSHYPYSDEMLDLADRLGILVIDEVPAVGMNYWSNRPVFAEGGVDGRTLSVHREQLTDLVARDKNHPSVVMLSVANEAATYEAAAGPYFEAVFKHARELTDLPLMIVENVGARETKAAMFADVIGVNRYVGWYVDVGDLDAIAPKLERELREYHETFGKPVFLTEFGADTIAGNHALPPAIFSEEYQVEFLKIYHETVAKLSFMIGEHVWNFADFATKQGITRFDGNRKGVFTRDRRPKMAAHWLRDAWKEADDGSS
ncbi:MAG: beta-glucuronidase [Candidatus Izemoplasmatales bacterium]